MAKAKALPAGIAAKALTPAKAKASASTEAQKRQRQRLSGVVALNASTVTPPETSVEIAKPNALPSAKISPEARKRKRTSDIGASSCSGSSMVEIDMDGSGKARGKRVRIEKDDVTSRLWSEEGHEVEVEGKWDELMGKGGEEDENENEVSSISASDASQEDDDDEEDGEEGQEEVNFEGSEDVEDVEDVDETVIPSPQTEVGEGLWRLEVPMAEEQEVEPRGPSPVMTFGERAREAIEARDQVTVRMRKVGGRLMDERYEEVESIEEEDGDEEMDNRDEMAEVAASSTPNQNEVDTSGEGEMESGEEVNERNQSREEEIEEHINMVKPKALTVGIAAKAVTPAKASASAEAQIRKRLPAVATSSPSILSRPRSRMEIDDSSSEEEGAQRRKPTPGIKVEALPQDLDEKTLAKTRHTNRNIAKVEDKRVVITDRRRVEYRIRWYGESESRWENAAKLVKRNRRARKLVENFDHTHSYSEVMPATAVAGTSRRFPGKTNPCARCGSKA